MGKMRKREQRNKRASNQRKLSGFGFLSPLSWELKYSGCREQRMPPGQRKPPFLRLDQTLLAAT
jgi:hypothetical protein